MVNTTLLFFLLLLPISGFIAWAGDRIGHKLGKRRATLLGLRPRHTAMLITIATGIGITVASFGTMLFISRSFRQVVARGGELARDNQQLQQTVDEAGRRVEKLKEEANAQDFRLQSAQKARIQADTKRATADAAVVGAQDKLHRAEKQLLVKQGSLTQTKMQLASAMKRYRKASADVTSALRTRKLAYLAASDASRQAATAKKASQDAKLRVTTAERVFEAVMQQQRLRLSEQRVQLKELEDAIGKQRAELRAQLQVIQAQQDTLDMQSTRLERQREQSDVQQLTLQRVNLEVRELSQKRDDIQRTLDALSIEAVTVRSGKITYRNGEEVARIQIPASKNVSRIQNTLETLLAVAAKNAENRGAKATKSSSRAVRIPQRTVRGTNGATQSVSEFEALAAVAENIVSANEPVVIVLFAVANAVSGEPVTVDVKTYRNPLLFPANAILGELRVRAGSTRADLADQLYNLLRGDIRRKLLRAGIIPPSLGAGIDGEPIGETRIDDILQILDIARSASRAVIVVRSTSDIHAGDPVKLRFELQGVETPPSGSQGTGPSVNQGNHD